MSGETQYSFIGRDLAAQAVQFVKQGKAWAEMDAAGVLLLFDEAECRKAAQGGDPYARMTVAIIDAERERVRRTGRGLVGSSCLAANNGPPTIKLHYATIEMAKRAHELIAALIRADTKRQPKRFPK